MASLLVAICIAVFALLAVGALAVQVYGLTGSSRTMAAAFLLIIVTACAQGAPSAEGRRPKPVMLDQGMTEAQVMEVLGPPDQTDNKMCGERTGESWPCVVWIYNRNNRQMWLIVLFEKGPPMKLNSWYWP